MDYDEQRKWGEAGRVMFWDDTKSNDTKEGDLFGFVFGSGSDSVGERGEGLVRIHRVLGIATSAARPPSWSAESRIARGCSLDDLPDHEDRDVLVLSPQIAECTWVEFNRVTGRANDGFGKQIGLRKMTPPLQGTKRWNL